MKATTRKQLTEIEYEDYLKKRISNEDFEEWLIIHKKRQRRLI